MTVAPQVETKPIVPIEFDEKKLLSGFLEDFKEELHEREPGSPEDAGGSVAD